MKGSLKKIFFILTIIIITFISVSSIYYKNKIEEEKDYRVIKVGGDLNFPPFEYIDDNGIYTGFNVDIIRAIALRGGFEVEFYPMKWEEACKKLKNGEIDVIQGMKYTMERSKYYDFSEGYLENSQSIFVMENNYEIDSYETLRGNTVAIQEGDIAINNLKGMENINIVSTKDQEEAFKKLINGEVDAIICNTLTGVNYLDKLKVRNRIKPVDMPLNYTAYSMVVKKGNSKVLGLLNKGLKEIQKNGTYEMVYRKWFGNTNDYPKWYIKNIIKVLLIGSTIFIIIILLFYLWNDMLKDEVKKHTYKLEEANESLKKKNEHIKEEKDFREWILNSIFNGIITINDEGKITFINDMALKILNLEPKEIMHEYIYNTVIKEIFSQEGNINGSGLKEYYIEDKKIYINYNINILNENNQYCNESIISFRDVTEEKLMQETIRTKDKMESLGTLLSGIAHELRNPLTSIKTYAELLPRKYENPRFREMISIDIPKEIERLNNLINDLLEYSRPRRPFKEHINLYDVIDNLLRLINDKIHEEDTKINLNIHKEAYVFIDKNHLKQVLINLILNAIECMDKEEKIIDIYSYIVEGGIMLCISDNGPGIDGKDIGKIYNPFYTTKSYGTGLGLFVSYQLLKENGVNIYIESSENVGTTFKLYFKNVGDGNNI
ncbi:transporter substrate-binding domain-containing protein [Clostridium sp. MSJ-11]|uniref:Transporter substrate-binding domain-containing protein n=1 Tax=Clostridium mobile TaxID=2841512 RepID=A0ABS6EJM9_9CLOT|nr:transporter substrate-binding domain-containing protein [Clostridium mobile]MBU5485429.1 transporter substrate-binding domain-containing protein [Clostridium mobile]